MSIGHKTDLISLLIYIFFAIYDLSLLWRYLVCYRKVMIQCVKNSKVMFLGFSILSQLVSDLITTVGASKNFVRATLLWYTNMTNRATARILLMVLYSTNLASIWENELQVSIFSMLWKFRVISYMFFPTKKTTEHLCPSEIYWKLFWLSNVKGRYINFGFLIWFETLAEPDFF